MKRNATVFLLVIILVVFSGSLAFAGSRKSTILNNPYNIKKSSFHFWGRVENNVSMFEQFRNMSLATAAFLKLIKVNYIAKGYDTVEKIMYRYAPPSDGNDTEKYISFITGKTGCDRADKINLADFNFSYNFAAAIAFFESGYKLKYLTALNAHRFFLTYY